MRKRNPFVPEPFVRVIEVDQLPLATDGVRRYFASTLALQPISERDKGDHAAASDPETEVADHGERLTEG